jgi:hypothetical protein
LNLLVLIITNLIFGAIGGLLGSLLRDYFKKRKAFTINHHVNAIDAEAVKNFFESRNK